MPRQNTITLHRKPKRHRMQDKEVMLQELKDLLSRHEEELRQFHERWTRGNVR